MTRVLLMIQVAIWACGGVLPLVAQDGDFLLYDNFGHVRILPRGPGSPAAVPIPAGLHSAWASTAGPIDTLYLSGKTSGPGVHILSFGAGGVTTVATFALQGTIHGLDIDDAGELRFVLNDFTDGYLYTAPLGSSTARKIYTWPRSLRWPKEFIEDPASGHLFFPATTGQRYLRLDPVTGVVTSMTPAPQGKIYFSDPITGELILGINGSVARFDLQTGKTTTIFRPPASIYAAVNDVHLDQATRHWIIAGRYVNGLVSYGVLGMMDTRGTMLSLRAPSVPFSSFERVEVANGRAFVPVTAPVRGRDYRVFLRAHRQPGVAYQAAFAFTHRPGIRTPAGTIPLTPDSLFAASLAGGPSFGYLSGRLDSRGAALLELRLRVLPVGQRLHLAAITYDGSGIRSILGPHSFTVR